MDKHLLVMECKRINTLNALIYSRKLKISCKNENVDKKESMYCNHCYNRFYKTHKKIGAMVLLIVIKIVALLFTLGIDNLLMSTTVGMLNPNGKVKIAFTFASAEAIMPLIGLLIGNVTGMYLGYWASLVGGVLLLVVGGSLFFFDDDDDKLDTSKQRWVGWSLFLSAITISLDELAVGFSIGLIGVPIVLTMILIACSAFLFTTVGVMFGSRIKRYLGEWAEKLGGVILAVLGVWMLIEGLINL